MSASTAEAPTRVTRRTVVTTETPATTKPNGFTNWLRGIGSSISRGWHRFWGGVGRAARWITNKIRVGSETAWTKAGQGIRWVGNKIYWGGAATGRFIGRGARFFGRSSLTLARGTTRFLGRTVGWTLRGVSWTTRTVLESVFAVSLAAWLVIGLVTMFLAWGHDSYEQNVHRHAKAASRGEYRADRPGTVGAAEAQRTFARSADRQASRVEHWDTVSETVVEEVEERVPFRFTNLPIDEQIAIWQIREPELTFPEGLTMDEIREAVFNVMDFTRPKGMKTDFNAEGERVFPLSLPETEVGQAMTDNEIFQGDSYWAGRNEASTYFDMASREINLAQPWEGVAADARNRLGMAWKAADDRAQAKYGKRELVRSQYKSGWDHQVTYLMGWLEHFRDKVLSAEQKAEADQPKPSKKATAKKQPAKKTTARA